MKHINKNEWKKTTKYIAGSTGAVALAVASCVAGITGTGTDVAKHDKEYLAGDDKASDTDATTIMNTDDLADQLADNVNLKEKDVDKDETVYVFAKANGDVDNILVNETLKNRDKSDKIEDTTDLKDIVNVKGDETFTQNGNKITWDAAGNEISYQGTTDKQLPVSVKATYYLDGNEISPEELAGKSGKVKIRLDYTSNEKVTKEVNGKEEDISVPFVAVSGMVLGDNFTNIQVTNGKYLAQGESNIVVGYAVPGLDSGVKDAAEDLDTEIPDYVEVSADVTDFSLDMTVTMLVNGSEMDYSGDLDLTDLDKLTDSLSSAGNQLATGSGDLSDGATQVADGAGTLADKMGDLTTGAGSLKAGMETLSSSSGDLASGVAVIDQSAQSIANGINTLDTAVNTKMTDAEKAAVAQQAASQVSASVEAQFAAGTDTYNYIYNSAVNNYTTSMSNATDTLYQQYKAAMYDTMVQSALAGKAALAAQSASQTAAANAIQAGQTQEQAQAAGAIAFAQSYQAYMANADNQAAVAGAVDAQLKQLAESTTSGLAEGGKAALGQSVVDACKSAATTAASQAAGAAAVQGAETAKATIASQIEATQANGYSLVSGANALAQGTSTLAGSVPALKEGISQLVTGANALASGAGQLKDGAVTLADGASQVADGAGTLNESLVTLNNEAIKKMVSAYNGDVKDSVERLQAAMEAATEYDSFGGKSDNTAGVTKFIIKTAAISAE